SPSTPVTSNETVPGSGTFAQVPWLIAKLPTPHSHGSTMIFEIEPQPPPVDAKAKPGEFVELNENVWYAVLPSLSKPSTHPHPLLDAPTLNENATVFAGRINSTHSTDVL